MEASDKVKEDITTATTKSMLSLRREGKVPVTRSMTNSLSSHDDTAKVFYSSGQMSGRKRNSCPPPSSRDGMRAKKRRNQTTTGTVNLPEKLLNVLSNLYLDPVERLKLRWPPRCANDLENCNQQHYRSPPPESISFSQSNIMCCGFKQERYLFFVNYCFDACNRGQFPGEDILTRILEFLLSYNSKSHSLEFKMHLYNKFVELFATIVRRFPPCWLALRPAYTSFFTSPIERSVISQHCNNHPKSENVFEILLDLLESTLTRSFNSDLQQVDNNNDNDYFPPKEHNYDAFLSPNEKFQFHSTGYFPARFDNLGCVRVQINRLFIALKLLLNILEYDFVMWILHHLRNPKEHFFFQKNTPFVALVFTLTEYHRFTERVSRLCTVFAVGVSRGMSRMHLQILERYISLVMVASNVADLKYTKAGVLYPSLEIQTKSLINKFFRVFKANNTSCVSSYLDTIELLRIPYVRFEFIDHFLQLFYLRSDEKMWPEKITNEIAKSRWLKYRPLASLVDGDEELSREKYMELMLTALRDYCIWTGCKTLFHMLINHPLAAICLTVITDSTHRWPVPRGGAILLPDMTRDIHKLTKKLRMRVRMSRPRVDMPLMKFCINDDLILKYRTDLKFILIVKKMIANQSDDLASVDFTKWRHFLVDFTEI